MAFSNDVLLAMGRSAEADAGTTDSFACSTTGPSEQLAERGFDRPQIAVINGMVKQHMTEFSDGDYRKHVRDPGDRYLATLPRPIALDDA